MKFVAFLNKFLCFGLWHCYKIIGNWLLWQRINSVHTDFIIRICSKVIVWFTRWFLFFTFFVLACSHAFEIKFTDKSIIVRVSDCVWQKSVSLNTAHINHFDRAIWIVNISIFHAMAQTLETTGKCASNLLNWYVENASSSDFSNVAIELLQKTEDTVHIVQTHWNVNEFRFHFPIPFYVEAHCKLYVCSVIPFLEN